MGWEEKITLQENTTSDKFGQSVAIYGNYAIVGAYLSMILFQVDPVNKERCIFTKETVMGNGNSIKRAPNTEKIIGDQFRESVSRFMEIMPLSVHLVMILFPDPGN